MDGFIVDYQDNDRHPYPKTPHNRSYTMQKNSICISILIELLQGARPDAICWSEDTL